MLWFVLISPKYHSYRVTSLYTFLILLRNIWFTQSYINSIFANWSRVEIHQESMSFKQTMWRILLNFFNMFLFFSFSLWFLFPLKQRILWECQWLILFTPFPEIYALFFTGLVGFDWLALGFLRMGHPLFAGGQWLLGLGLASWVSPHFLHLFLTLQKVVAG